MSDLECKNSLDSYSLLFGSEKGVPESDYADPNRWDDLLKEYGAGFDETEEGSGHHKLLGRRSTRKERVRKEKAAFVSGAVLTRSRGSDINSMLCSIMKGKHRQGTLSEIDAAERKEYINTWVQSVRHKHCGSDLFNAWIWVDAIENPVWKGAEYLHLAMAYFAQAWDMYRKHLKDERMMALQNALIAAYYMVSRGPLPVDEKEDKVGAESYAANKAFQKVFIDFCRERPFFKKLSVDELVKGLPQEDAVGIQKMLADETAPSAKRKPGVSYAEASRMK